MCIRDSYWKDTGTPNDIIHANGEVLKNMKSYNFSDVDKTTTLTGNVMIGKNSKIFGNSEIIGPCIIGENCQIGPNAIIGPNCSINNDSQISNCSIQNSIIMKNCIIDSKIKIHNSIIASNSKISIVNNEIINLKTNHKNKSLTKSKYTQWWESQNN